LLVERTKPSLFEGSILLFVYLDKRHQPSNLYA
jgi:hypothetical protein